MFFGERDVVQHVVAPERLHKEEAQGRHSLANAVGGKFSFSKQMYLILAAVLRSQLVRRTMEVLSELLQNEGVGLYGILGVISTLEFIEHLFSQMGHSGPPFYVNHTIACLAHSCYLSRHASASAAQRLCSNGVRGECELPRGPEIQEEHNPTSRS